MVFAVIAMTAAPLMAQERNVQDPAGYVSGFGGAAWAAGNSTSSVLFEGGVRIAPHVMAFTNAGRFTNLQTDLQPTLDGPRSQQRITAIDEAVEVQHTGNQEQRGDCDHIAQTARDNRLERPVQRGYTRAQQCANQRKPGQRTPHIERCARLIRLA